MTAAPPAGFKPQEAVRKGAFVKHCPCSPGSVPCGCFNLNLHTGCPYSGRASFMCLPSPHKGHAWGIVCAGGVGGGADTRTGGGATGFGIVI